MRSESRGGIIGGGEIVRRKAVRRSKSGPHRKRYGLTTRKLKVQQCINRFIFRFSQWDVNHEPIVHSNYQSRGVNHVGMKIRDHKRRRLSRYTKYISRMLAESLNITLFPSRAYSLLVLPQGQSLSSQNKP